MYRYCALSPSQIEALKVMISEFLQEPTKHKKLYEITCTEHDIDLFQRNSDPNIYCVRSSCLYHVQNIKMAKEALSSSFGTRVIEFK